MSTQILQATENGRHIVDGPVTVAVTNEAVPGLIQNAIDRRIVKVRPTSTPIDQLSRCGGARKAGSMKVDYYSVDPKPTFTRVAEDVPKGLGTKVEDGIFTHHIKTEKDLLFEPTETVMFPEIMGENGEPLVAYVVARDPSGGINVIAVNAPIVGKNAMLPDIPAGSTIIRMGRAAAELDVQTAQFQSLPTKCSNNCQIFKIQVEESTLHRIANKEVGWSFSDQEEAAIIDMRLGMEKNFLFGSKAVLRDPTKNEDIFLTGGIWKQAGRQFIRSRDNFGEDVLIDIAREAFTGNCGSKSKIFVCGSELMSLITKIECKRVRRGSDTRVKWGLTFSEIDTNFGSLYIIHSEVFDQCGHSFDGMVIDPDYLTKYVHIPFQTEQIDLRRSGQRNTSAVVITEASCLVLRYPEAHMRVILSNNPVE